MPAIRSGTDKPKRKAPKTAFAPGKSGNPAGRPKRTQEEIDLIAACKAKTGDALAVIDSIMRNPKANERNRLAAAQAIIERAHGKPVQPVSGDHDRPPIMHEVRLVPMTANG